MTNSNSDLLSILPRTEPDHGEQTVDSTTARKKIMDILKKYPSKGMGKVRMVDFTIMRLFIFMWQ